MESFRDSTADESEHKNEGETREENDGEIVSVWRHLNGIDDFAERFHGSDLCRQLPHLLPIAQLFLALFRHMRCDFGVLHRGQNARHLFIFK